MTEHGFRASGTDNDFTSRTTSEKTISGLGFSPASHDEAGSYRNALNLATSSSMDSAHLVLEQMDHGNRFGLTDMSAFTELSTQQSIDKNTGRRCTDIQYKDGTTEHKEFDPTTGRLLSDESKDSDGRTVHQDFDPATGNKILEKIDDPRADRCSSTEYDSLTGNPKSRDQSNGFSSLHTEFDPFTGKPVSGDLRFNDGTVEHTEYARDTGTRKFTDIHNPDGSRTHEEFGPDGAEVSADVTSADGTNKHIVDKPDGQSKTSYPDQTPWWGLNPVGMVNRWISQ